MKLFYTVPSIIVCSLSTQAAIPSDLQQTFENYIALAREIEPILAGATDKQTADDSALALYDILPKVYEARTVLQKIENLTPELQAELVEKYGKTMQTEWGKVYEQIFRLEKVNCYHSLSFFKQFRALCMMLQQ